MVEVNFGALGTFGYHFAKALAISKLFGQPVTFLFGGVNITASLYSYQQERFNAYRAALLCGRKYA